MARSAILFAVAASLFLLLGAGCETTIGRDLGPKYDVDWDKLGSGQSVFSPLNDNQYMDGMPMDARTKKSN
jgi:hypothetical protein